MKYQKRKNWWCLLSSFLVLNTTSISPKWKHKPQLSSVAWHFHFRLSCRSSCSPHAHLYPCPVSDITCYSRYWEYLVTNSLNLRALLYSWSLHYLFLLSPVFSCSSTVYCLPCLFFKITLTYFTYDIIDHGHHNFLIYNVAWTNVSWNFF